MYVARREFLGIGLGTLVGIQSSRGEGFRRQPQSNLLPALAAYSFRNHFQYIKGNSNKNFEAASGMDMVKFIHYCGKYGVGAELTSYFFPPEADDSYFANCRKEAHLNGVPIAGTAVGNQFTLKPDSDEAKAQMAYVKKWIDRAVLMGAPHIRVFAGRIPKGMEESVAENHAIESLKVAGEYAATKGIFLGVENHDSIGSADKLLKMVDAVDNPWVGINLDSGNFRTADPYTDFARSVPQTVNVQLKVALRIDGKKEPVDMDRIFTLLRAGGYSGFVVLEYEESDPLKNVPATLEELKKYTAN